MMGQPILAWKRIVADDGGHAMVFLLAFVGVVMVFAAGIYISSEIAVAKIKAQNASDAAAMAGAGLLADSLDLLVFANWVRSGSYLFFGLGRTVRATIDTLARQTVGRASVVAIARAVQVGLANGALVVPVHNPDLGVSEAGVLGVRFYRDALRGRIGNRFVRVAATVNPNLPEWMADLLDEPSFLGLSLQPVALAEATVLGRGLGRPKFKGVLSRVRQ